MSILPRRLGGLKRMTNSVINPAKDYARGAKGGRVRVRFKQPRDYERCLRIYPRLPSSLSLSLSLFHWTDRFAPKTRVLSVPSAPKR
jgi:hypothetical protein